MEEYRSNIIHLEKGKWLTDGKIEETFQKLEFSNLDSLSEKIKIMLVTDTIHETDLKCLRRFKNLEHLNLKFKTSIDKDLFNSFENLTNLELELQSLKNLSEFLFTSLTKLKELSLALNETKLNKNHFKGLQNLEALRLTGIELDEDLDCFFKLKKLNLQAVKFNKFMLCGLETLEILEINYWFKVKKLFLRLLPSFFQKLKDLKCLHINLSEIPEDCNFILKEIIQSIPTSVETLVTNLKFFNYFSLYPNPSPFIQNLKHLSIDFDDKQKHQIFRTFKENLFRNLESLSFNSWEICETVLELKILKNLRHLKSLQLYSFILDGIDAEFNYLTKGNFAHRLPENISNFIHLKSLSLRHVRELISIDERFLEDLVNLEDLTLNRVFISIDPNVQFLFKSLIKLKRLHFYRNKMHVIKSSYFEYLVNLEEVNLSSNGISVIEPAAFVKLSQLKQLDLSHNYDLKDIKREIFSSNKILEKIIFNRIRRDFVTGS